MKKLKLKKETISILKDQKVIVGGAAITYANVCGGGDATGKSGCANYTQAGVGGCVDTNNSVLYCSFAWDC